MKPEAQLRALLEWLGWKVRWSEANNAFVGTPPADWENPLKKLSTEWRIPPLTLDLMHEAEKILTRDQQDDYSHNLSQIVPQNYNCGPIDEGGPDLMIHTEFDIAHATKEQRLEAMIRTLNLWKEDK